MHPTSNMFGANKNLSVPLFGADKNNPVTAFGTDKINPVPSFGAPTQSIGGFGTPVITTGPFGSTVTGPFAPGSIPTPQPFGTQSIGSGNTAAPSTTPWAFGAPAAGFGAFGATGSSAFGAPVSTASPVFGAPTTSTVFGGPSGTTRPFAPLDTQATGTRGPFGASGNTPIGSDVSTKPFASAPFKAESFRLPENVFGTQGTFGTPAHGVFPESKHGVNDTMSNPFAKPMSTASVTSAFGNSNTTNVFATATKPYTATTSGVVFGAVPSTDGTETSKSTPLFGVSKAFSAGNAQESSAKSMFSDRNPTVVSSPSMFGGASTTTVSSTALFKGPKAFTVAAPNSGPMAVPGAGLFGAAQPASFGAAKPAPFGAAKPAPFGAAKPAPFGAAKPAPFGAAKPAPFGAAKPAPFSSVPLGAATLSTSSTISVFSTSSSSSSMSNVNNPPKPLFGRQTASIGEHSENPFGKTSEATKSEATKSEATKSEATKAEATKSEATFKNPFAKSTTSSAEAPTNLFGKQAASTDAPKKLFGKPAAETPSMLFVKPKIPSEPAAEGKVFNHPVEVAKPSSSDTEKKPTGLFGKVIASVATRPTKPGQGLASKVISIKKDEVGTKTTPKGDSKVVRRRKSLDDTSQLTVLVAKNVPLDINSKHPLRQHFSRFGKVTKVFSNPTKDSAVIHFENHEGALKAKKNGTINRPGLPKMTFFWRNFMKSMDVSPQITSKSHAVPTSIKKKLFAKPITDVDKELASLAGADNEVFGNQMRTLARPTGLEIDPLAGSVTGEDVRSKASGQSRNIKRALAKVSRQDKARSVSPLSRLGPVTRESDGSESKGRVIPKEASAKPSVEPLVSVKTLFGKKCPTDQDRVDVLEARDRLLREGLKVLNKGTDFATARVLRGTSMDMCPEKERYLRQVRRRLTIYEIHPESEGRGVVDHARALKEYSRSSADQDMPLANELRPPEVLDRTMTFILNNIIELGGDGRWSDWFEYIWSRTRSIRKDITQQQLCDQTAASLVERCTRFHIYCAERLCMEDANVFDMKINDENLTKCLQTLKELYHDLAMKHSQTCPNEPEFRAYIVLMNLNKGDTLRETQQLKDKIRESEPVKFALSVYSALNSNNYIRFFKLVRKATFLNACILHRYFRQMRSAALLTMCMAYSRPGNVAQVPISDLVRNLGFEDSEEVVMFCEHCGLPTENDCISMMRHNFVDPEAALPISRAKMLIETKLTVLPGEVMHGGPLPPNEILIPTSSFDAEGRFCPDSLTLQIVRQQEEGFVPVNAPGISTASLTASGVQPVFTPTVRIKEPVAATEQESEQVAAQHQFSNDAVKMVAKDIFLDVIKEICDEMSRTLVRTCHAIVNTASPLTEDIINNQVTVLVRDVSEEVLKEEKVEQEARGRAEQSISRERIVQQISKALIEEFMNVFLHDVAKEENEETESKDRISSEYAQNLLLTVLTSETEKLTSEFYKHEVLTKREQLAYAEKATNVLRQRRHFKRWKNKFALRQRLKRSMLDFPAAPSMDTPRERLMRILPKSKGLCEERNAVHLGKNAWLTLTPPNVVVENEKELIREILRQNDETRQKEALSSSSIDLCKLVGPPLIKKLGVAMEPPLDSDIEQVYWKLLVSLPRADTEAQMDYQEWIINKLSTEDDHFPPEIFNPSAQVIAQVSEAVHGANGQPVSVNVVVRHMIGNTKPMDLVNLIQGRHLQATNAVLFVIDRSALASHQAWDTEAERLLQVLQVFDNAKLSVVIGTPPDMVVLCREKLAAFCESVYYHTVMPLCENLINPLATLNVQEGIEVLAMNCAPQDHLEAEWITDYLQHGLQRFFFSKLQNSVFSDRPEHFFNQFPSEMAALYNASIHHLSEVASDADLQSVSWPPTEFSFSDDDLPSSDWNSTKNLQYVGLLLDTLTLPPGDELDDLHDEMGWDEACESIWKYVNTVVEQTEGTPVFLISRVRKLLQQAFDAFNDRCFVTCGVSAVEPSSSDLPRSRIIKLCIDHKITFLNTFLPGGNQDELDYNELRIYYKQDQMDSFQVPSYWLSVCRLSQDPNAVDNSIRRAVKRKQDLVSSIVETAAKSPHLALSQKNNFSPRVHIDSLHPKLLEVQSQTGLLLTEMASETKAMDEYEVFLRNLLEAGDLPLPPVPQLPKLSNSYSREMQR